MSVILVIDDEAAIREMVRRFLTAEGHVVFEASDGAEAFRILRERETDVVITDLYMPGMDGIEFTIRLQQTESPPAVIAISGGGFGRQVDLLDIAAHVGARDVLAKPFTRDQLVAAVQRALTREETA